MTDEISLQIDDEAERELMMFVGSTLNHRGGEAGDRLDQLGNEIMDGSIEPDDFFNAHGAPVGFLEEHHGLIEVFCEDLDEDAADLLRHAASIHTWCVATARRIQRGEDPQHYASGVRSAMEWTTEKLSEVDR